LDIDGHWLMRVQRRKYKEKKELVCFMPTYIPLGSTQTSSVRGDFCRDTSPRKASITSQPINLYPSLASNQDIGKILFIFYLHLFTKNIRVFFKPNYYTTKRSFPIHSFNAQRISFLRTLTQHRKYHHHRPE
jgi:hypothetical protein